MEMLRKAAEMRAAGQDACHNNVFIVHWTHVPKAGGTAFASLAKRAACAKNPELADSNPCCVRDVCVAEGSCHSTASTCPFVQGIGKHTSNMGRLPLVPCCGREWYLSTVSSFLRYALRPAPTPTEIAKYGLVYHADIPFEPVNKRRPEKKRVEFFAKTGVAWDELKRRLVEKKIVKGGDDQSPGSDLFRLREIAEAVAPPANMTYGRGDNRFPRPGEQNKQARHCAPNYDAYKLRPGLWIHPNDKSLYPAPIAKKKWTFKEFLGAVRNCRKLGRGQTCDMVTGCHGYHNASRYLAQTHADRAADTLAKHSFFGLLEAYNASVLLAAHEFKLTGLVDDDFAQSRASASLKAQCSPSKVLRADGDACRYAFDAYYLDNVVYERAHRVFCDRLESAGLAGQPAIRAELDRNRLCGETRFDDVEHVCGVLETPEAVARLNKLRDACPQRGGNVADWWISPGYWKPGSE
ncbi:acid phosphatase [Aureococcus anophagefferens]|nr:acid phosphatase [Aureococcus anophagefferens]